MFTVDGQEYSPNEQYFQSNKAKLNGYHELKNTMMSTSEPVRQKRLGQQVKTNEAWPDRAAEVMSKGLHAKFSQNLALKDFLLTKTAKVIVAANPYDSYWGAALPLHNSDVFDESKWRGKNVLGKILSELKSNLS